MDRHDSGFEDLILFLAPLIPVSYFTTALTFIFWFVVKLQSSSGFGDFARQRSLWVHFETKLIIESLTHTGAVGWPSVPTHQYSTSWEWDNFRANWTLLKPKTENSWCFNNISVSTFQCWNISALQSKEPFSDLVLLDLETTYTTLGQCLLFARTACLHVHPSSRSHFVYLIVFWLFNWSIKQNKLNAAPQGWQERQDLSNSLHEKKKKDREGKLKREETGWAAYHPQPLSVSILLSSSSGLILIGIYEISPSPSSWFSFLLCSKGTLVLLTVLLLYPVQRSSPNPPLEKCPCMKSTVSSVASSKIQVVVSPVKIKYIWITLKKSPQFIV